MGYGGEGLFAGLFGEGVAGVGVFDGEVVLGIVEAEDRAGGGGDAIHALPFEVGVADWGADEDGARSDDGEDAVEIEGELVEWIVEKAGHVAFAGPAFDVAVHVVAEGVHAAA